MKIKQKGTNDLASSAKDEHFGWSIDPHKLQKLAKKAISYATAITEVVK